MGIRGLWANETSARTVGEKVVRKCPMLAGVTIKEGAKDELVIEGNDIENVSQSAASITDKCRVKEKDVRGTGRVSLAAEC